MVHRMMALALAGMLMAGSAFAQDTTAPSAKPQQAPAQATASTDDDEKVCKTKRQWAEEERSSQDAVQGLQAKGGMTRSGN